MLSIKNKSYKLCVAFIILCISSNINNIYASDFISRGFYVIDLRQKIEWLTCPVGMMWQKNHCVGKAMKIKFDEINIAVLEAGKQLGGKWRLPNRQELERLVCKKCKNEKINSKIFPNSPPASFWTGDINLWQPQFLWTVNFFTGYTFGRFPKFIPNYVRLVRDRK